jgi:hypothetical protein
MTTAEIDVVMIMMTEIDVVMIEIPDVSINYIQFNLYILILFS